MGGGPWRHAEGQQQRTLVKLVSACCAYFRNSRSMRASNTTPRSDDNAPRVATSNILARWHFAARRDSRLFLYVCVCGVVVVCVKHAVKTLKKHTHTHTYMDLTTIEFIHNEHPACKQILASTQHVAAVTAAATQYWLWRVGFRSKRGTSHGDRHVLPRAASASVVADCSCDL